MRRSIAAAAAAVAAAVLGACSSAPQSPLSGAASVTVNANDAKFTVVNCTQVQWYRTIHIGGDRAGATVVVDGRAERAIAESVQIQNVGGFTGMYSLGGEGDANTNLSGDRYTITGTANGYQADKSNEPTTATFKITATC